MKGKPHATTTRNPSLPTLCVSERFSIQLTSTSQRRRFARQAERMSSRLHLPKTKERQMRKTEHPLRLDSNHPIAYHELASERYKEMRQTLRLRTRLLTLALSILLLDWIHDQGTIHYV